MTYARFPDWLPLVNGRRSVFVVSSDAPSASGRFNAGDAAMAAVICRLPCGGDSRRVIARAFKPKKRDLFGR